MHFVNSRSVIGLVAALMCVSSAQAAKVVTLPTPKPQFPMPAEPSNPCSGSFYELSAADPQHDQVAGLPMHDFYESYTGETPGGLYFNFYVTSNPTIVPAQSRYEIRFMASDSADTYFVRVDSRGARDSMGLLVGDYSYGLYRGRADGLGSQEIVSRTIRDPGYFFANNTSVEYGDYIGFGIDKEQLESLVPASRGFDLGQSLRRLQVLSYSNASVLSVADSTSFGSYKLRFDQACRSR